MFRTTMAPSVTIIPHNHRRENPTSAAYDDPLHQESSDSQDDFEEDRQDNWTDITNPGPHDVLLGRGGGTNNHAGNVKFRKLVNEHKVRYLSCSKVDKPKVAREVVKLWRTMDPPGRFLARKDETKRGPGSVKASDNVWYEVGDKKAREKASQCLRERTPEVLPYIQQLREQQDAITEQGVSMVEQHLRLQSNPETALMEPSLTRRNSLPIAPAHGMNRTGYNPLPEEQQYYPTHAHQLTHGEDYYGADMTEVEYQRTMVMMQQQLHMQQVRLQRLQEQRAMQRATLYGYHHQHPSEAYALHPEENPQSDPLLTMPAQPVRRDSPRRPPKRTLSVKDNQKNLPRPDPTTSTVETAPVLKNDSAPPPDDSELTLEQYRQQLEEYIVNNNIPENHDELLLDDDDASDLEDDWEKEKQKAYGGTAAQRGVDRNVSGMSLMSLRSSKTSHSMISGMSGLSDLMDNDEERKRNLERALSSNLSLMSELTDLSKNLDDLSLYADGGL